MQLLDLAESGKVVLERPTARLHPDDDELDCAIDGKSNEAIDVVRADRHAFRLGGDARISGCAV